jgi:hypothetical protein
MARPGAAPSIPTPGSPADRDEWREVRWGWRGASVSAGALTPDRDPKLEPYDSNACQSTVLATGRGGVELIVGR